MLWNEQDHPREENGQFAFKNGGKTNSSKENPKDILYQKSIKQKEIETIKQKRKNELLDILKDKATPADILYGDEKSLSKKIEEMGLDNKTTNETIWKNPAENAKISSPYGWRVHPIQGTKKHHNGIDIATPQGSSVKAQAEGTVEHAGLMGSYGNLIIINHGKINGKEVKTKYAHLSKINVKKGDKIDINTEIAKSGGKKGTPGAGSSTGAHLHLEVLEDGKHVNPQKYFKF